MSRARKSNEMNDAEARRIAVEDLERNLFVEAGAGTGKTTILVKRIIEIVRTGRARLVEIAAITFTEKAAGELLHRVRSELEDTLAGESDPKVRERCEMALEDVERAPISTIHGLAGQILRERPLEAGVDPGFTPLDAIAAEFATEEAWEAWLPGALERNPLPARRALLLGIDLRNIQKLGKFLLEHRERLGPATMEERAPPDTNGLLARWANIDEQLQALAHSCRDSGDRAFAQIHCLKKLLPEARALASSGNQELLEHFLLQELSIKPKHGNKTNWSPKEDCDRVKELFQKLADLKAAWASALNHEAVRNLVAWLGGFVEHALADRRKRGVLTFQDYLVECRDLLQRNFEAREYFQNRFRYLLLDEFQDTDPLQVEIAFFLAEERPEARDWRRVRLQPGKIFIVGDPKQSIYRFRRADIELYEEVRERMESPDDILGIRKNFRCVPETIDWINRTFGILIQKPSDGRYQSGYVPLEADRFPAGVSTVRDLKAGFTPETADKARKEEAERLADLLFEVTGFSGRGGALQVGDKKTKELRPATWRDIGILFPATTGIWIHEEVLRQRGIPYHLEGGREFFRRQEVAGVLHSLEALDRPEDQQALAAALKSAVFGYTDADLVELIAAGGRLGYLFDPPAGLGGMPIAESLLFLRTLHEERNRLPMANLVGRLLDDTGASCASALRRRGGLAASQNLKKLVEFARRFDGEDITGASFGRFSRWLRRMASSDAKEEESPTFEERDDVVRLLTIHKAKGLEFPVVILINLVGGERFRDRFIWTGGKLEVRLANSGGRDPLQTAGFEDAKDWEKKRQRAERIRLLYVASTRARDYLFISRIAREGREEGGLLHHLMEHPAREEVKPAPAPTGVEAAGRDEGLQDITRLYQEIESRPAEIEKEYKSTKIVKPSELHGDLGDDRKKETARDGLPPESGKALAFGTAVHRALEAADLSSKGNELRRLSSRMAMETGIPELADEVFQNASRALQAEVLQRARGSPCVRREMPFLTDIDEKTTVGGVIDLVFEEKGSFTIVDYKTDRIGAEEVSARVEVYREQITLYARAVAKITGRDVRRAVLVFTQSGVERSLEL